MSKLTLSVNRQCLMFQQKGAPPVNGPLAIGRNRSSRVLRKLGLMSARRPIEQLQPVPRTR